MQTIIELNDEIFKQSQRLAERERTTLNRLIEEALALRLSLSTPKQRPVALPIYQGSGGLSPSVVDSLTNRALLEAADDVVNR